MLQSLHIVNFAIIEDTVIEFGPGVTVFTGETGAGKSILIDALAVLTGRRARTDLIRTGADFFKVEGVFYADRKTVAADIRDLQEAGWDIICNRGRQNQYFIGDRGLELAELKLIIDAVQAARFISPHKTEAIVEKLTQMAGPSDREELHRRLFVQGKAKTTNEAVLYTIDLLHTAIRQRQAVEFQYLEYTSQKEKVPKHGGQFYCLSPYDLVWDSDRYYVVGWSESHGKVATSAMVK